MIKGFLNDQHRAAFEFARSEHRRGGSKAKCCGAKTRGGGWCRMPPLTEQLRCLRHAGPVGARRHRESQLRELAAGRLDPIVFERAEQRRAANRLQRAWKADPWTPGTTIDLGLHEEAFRSALGVSELQLKLIPPAVLDWARWRFRRAHLDRRDPKGWRAALDALPGRVAAAGEPSESFYSDFLNAVAPHGTPAHLPSWSRRRRAGIKKTDQRTPQTLSAKPPCVRPVEEVEALGNVLVRHQRDLKPVLTLCKTDEDLLRIAAAYRNLIQPESTAVAARAWCTLVQDLSSNS